MSVAKYFESNVVTVLKDATLDEAIERIKAREVDNVVVIQEREGRPFPVGVLSLYDIVTKVFLKGSVDPKRVKVADIMSTELVTCSEDQGIYEAIEIMQRNNTKRLPVTDEDGVLVGIITKADLFEMISKELADLAQHRESRDWRKPMGAGPMAAHIPRAPVSL